MREKEIKHFEKQKQNHLHNPAQTREKIGSLVRQADIPRFLQSPHTGPHLIELVAF